MIKVPTDLVSGWLQSLLSVILEPKEIKSVTVSVVSPSICHEVMGPDVGLSSEGTSLIFGNPKRSLKYYPWVIYAHACSVVSDSLRPHGL